MTTNVIFLSMDIAILLFQTVGFACNGVILFMFLKVKELRRRPSLRIALFLTVSHFVYDLISLPCIIYMTCSWKTERIDMDPYVFLFISVPMPVLLKINLTLTVAVAFERALALYTPVIYRGLRLSSYALACFVLGSILGAVDVAVEFSVSPFRRVLNCGNIGCFAGHRFLQFWGVGNTVMGLLVVCLTVLVLLKLHRIQRHTPIHHCASKEAPKKLNQANLTTLGILVSSFVFLTIPSIAVGVVNMFGFSVFDSIGPFYTLCLVCTGICNCVVYIAMNKELLTVAKRVLRGMDAYSNTEHTIFRMSTAVSS
ncbi:hypothetical protein Q1695_007886 [Nippostrongylus brasiliensis]|nr:hypothetical protein Q1695_007886 [Nippostrongylus brasiliensis]